MSGLYNVEACGASGGDYATLGGKGAKVKGTIRLHKGTQLTLLIGQEGRSGGGGGATFVVFTSNLTPLLVAGGGGGGGGVGNHNFSDGDPGKHNLHALFSCTSDLWPGFASQLQGSLSLVTVNI